MGELIFLNIRHVISVGEEGGLNSKKVKFKPFSFLHLHILMSC